MVPKAVFTTQKQALFSRDTKFFLISVCASLAISVVCLSWIRFPLLGTVSETTPTPLRAAEYLDKCKAIRLTPGPPTAYIAHRTQSDRYVPGTPRFLLRNATVWTGRHNGTEVLRETDIFLEGGLIKSIGQIPSSSLQHLEVNVLELNGAWVTPGIVDMHSHIGDSPSPQLAATELDDNSLNGPILPWLRSIDGLNTHDDSFALSISGGVTAALVLPGSANAIGGQAFPIKLRRTAAKTPTSLLIEVPETFNQSGVTPSKRPVWRHMKHACGENPGGVYGGSRMDTYWAFRQAYNKARELRDKQDEFCSLAESGIWNENTVFPENLQWEALIDVLRGRVKVHTHCYEAVDLDAMIRITKEFQFPIAAFHHAHEAYLVPDLLKTSWGGTPAVAIFATNARYKREAYRGSEFAAQILSRQDIPVVMKSDHPVLDSRYLLYEAQQAHFYGLPGNLALASVTTTPAHVMALDYRLGFVREGFDADLVVWDSHPLMLGATPLHVFIDGISQLSSSTSLLKPSGFQKSPQTPDFSQQAMDAVTYDGLPPLVPRKTGQVLFFNVATVWQKHGAEIRLTRDGGGDLFSVLVQNGHIVCVEPSCEAYGATDVVDLNGGSLSPGLVTYGADAGLEEISAERSTNDGRVLDPLTDRIPSITGQGTLVRAVDGLAFGGRDLLLAYQTGVTSAITAPTHNGFVAGLGTAFSTAALHKLEKGAILQDITALHMAIHPGRKIGVSSHIAALRNLLHGGGKDEVRDWFGKITSGQATLVIETESADIIASILYLKAEVESRLSNKLKITISGGAEAHLLSRELAAASVGVVLRPSRPFPTSWEKRRFMAGPPITHMSAISQLITHNVTVGIGIEELWSCRNLRFDAAWAHIDGQGLISKAQALALASSNLELLLGSEAINTDLVATINGDLLDVNARVVAIISSRRATTDMIF